MKSGINVQNVDYKAATVYLAIHMKPKEIEDEGLEEVIPKRRRMKGRKPGMAGSGMTRRKVLEKNEEKDEGNKIDEDEEDDVDEDEEDNEKEKPSFKDNKVKDEEKFWLPASREPTEKEKRMILGKVIEIAIVKIMENQ